jgi:hypothetical protein
MAGNVSFEFRQKLLLKNFILASELYRKIPLHTDVVVVAGVLIPLVDMHRCSPRAIAATFLVWALAISSAICLP